MCRSLLLLGRALSGRVVLAQAGVASLLSSSLSPRWAQSLALLLPLADCLCRWQKGLKSFQFSWSLPATHPSWDSSADADARGEGEAPKPVT